MSEIIRDHNGHPSTSPFYTPPKMKPVKNPNKDRSLAGKKRIKQRRQK